MMILREPSLTYNSKKQTKLAHDIRHALRLFIPGRGKANFSRVTEERALDQINFADCGHISRRFGESAREN
jgi:hypothetical protein